jgi:hypothetical protein
MIISELKTLFILTALEMRCSVRCRPSIQSIENRRACFFVYRITQPTDRVPTNQIVYLGRTGPTGYNCGASILDQDISLDLAPKHMQIEGYVYDSKSTALERCSDKAPG